MISREVMNSIHAVAHHEAGHAVAHVLLKMPFRYVTIRPRTPGVGGQVRRYGARWVDMDGRESLNDAAIGLAGPIAHGVYLATRNGNYNQKIAGYVTGVAASDSDLEGLSAIRAQLGENKAKAVIKLADELVGENFDTISVVANELMLRKILTHRDVRSIVADAQHNRSAA